MRNCEVPNVINPGAAIGCVWGTGSVREEEWWSVMQDIDVLLRNNPCASLCICGFRPRSSGGEYPRWRRPGGIYKTVQLGDAVAKDCGTMAQLAVWADWGTCETLGGVAAAGNPALPSVMTKTKSESVRKWRTTGNGQDAFCLC